jgi:branched-chain amino acid transport system substrate-binding protein
MRRGAKYGTALAFGVMALGAVAALRPALAGDPSVNPASFVRPPEHLRAAPRTALLPTPSDIRVGLLLAGGRHAALSADIADGLSLAVAEVGQVVRGHRIVVLRSDGDGSPESAAERGKGLLADAGVDVFVGPAAAIATPALRDLADAKRIPLVVPIPGAAVLAAVACSPYVLHLAPGNDQVAGPLGTWVRARTPVKLVYLLAPEDAGSRSQVAAFKRNFVAAGGEVVGEEYVSQANPDFSPYLAKLRLMGADSVYAPFTGDAATAFARQYEALGMAKQRVALVGATASQGGLDGGAIGAVDYVPALDTPENRRFQTEFAKAFGRPPSEHAARGYDAGRLIVEALRATGGRTDDPDTFAAQLAAVSFTGPRGLVRADPRRAAAIDHVYIVRTRDGDDGARYELLDRVAPASTGTNICATSPRN